MRILVVNWQDRENPQAGGAETHLHEIFGRLAQAGHAVTLLCGGWPGCAPRATLDGIAVHRVGTRYTFPALARRAWQAHHAGQHDVLVEDINKVPLFTPGWGAGPVVGLVPHLFGGTAFQELPAPVASLVWLAERPIPWRYRGIPFQAISQSTADDLVARGLRREDLTVIYCGIDTDAYRPDPRARASTPTFAYLGRLKKYKRVDLVIRAFAALPVPDARLEIAGAGDHRPALERLVHALDLSGRVRFLGRITEEEKRHLLQRAWALMLTSPKEGWGITNLEAAASGTPVIASDAPGIRESVRHGQTGFLVPHGAIDMLTERMLHLVADPELVASLGRAGRTFAETFTWERAAAETGAHLQHVVLGGR